MKTDIPQAVLDATQPIEEIPALQLTWYFVGGSSHTVIAPENAFEMTDNCIQVTHNGLETTVYRDHVTYVEQRHTVIRKRKEPKS